MTPLAKRLVRDVFDAGLMLGQSVRTIDAGLPAGAGRRHDLHVADRVAATWPAARRCSSASRSGFSSRCSARQSRLIAAIEKARDEERGQYGETVYLLEPNVKRSRGGLRDIQLLRWIGFVRYGATDPDGLQLRGAHQQGRPAAAAAGRPSSCCGCATRCTSTPASRTTCSTGPSRCGWPSCSAITGDGGPAAGRAVHARVFPPHQRRQPPGDAVRRRRVAGIEAGGRAGHAVQPSGRARLSRRADADRAPRAAGWPSSQADLAEILRLADLANLYDKRIAARHLRSRFAQAVPSLPDEVSPEAAERFLSLLSQPARLGEMLRVLHELGVLEKIIPDFAHARCLLQFNEYHKYTVDEHCLRAVEQATRASPPIAGRWGASIAASSRSGCCTWRC